MNYTAKNR